MEAVSTPSTSKVILQCTDPSNLLENFESRLSPWTPLRNLHWKSPSRPLRSIPSLNIRLVRQEAVQNGAGTAVRRHQIPGLRETPYVKLYLLRCDDKETYKETARREIKQWIKDNTFEKESKSSLKNQEHHDAFEWMIVHVVVPGTTAASQPASSKHLSLNDTESTDSLNSKSKWTGKSTSTIYDKLRADFSSSKLSVPRVAQVRLQEPGKPPGALPPSEVEEQWHEFVDNIKATILKSFDTRVAQYEDNIRERESQRALPGWNFCTFFMLKEGLARGFENVGLLDDALTVYSELEIGLDTMVKDQASREEGDISGALLPYSNDLKANIRRALDEDAPQPDEQSAVLSLECVFSRQTSDLPFDIERRNYRDLILANEVSPLDLRIYMFTRQMEILLRRARVAVSGSKESSLDYNIMADFAAMALNFINLGSRELRVDMQAAWGGRISGEDRALQKVVIDNAVASWGWRAVLQILRHLLPISDLDLTQFEKSVDVLEEDARLDQPRPLPRTPNGRSPTSSASSSPRRELRPESLSRAVSRSPAVLDEPGSKQLGIKKPGYERLLSITARFFLLARKIVENLPAVTPWAKHLRDLKIPGYENASHKLHRLSSTLSIPTIDGADKEAEGESQLDPPLRTLKGLGEIPLTMVASSEEAFRHIYQSLSLVMHHLYVEANNKHSARQVLIDLAMLAFSKGDYAFAGQSLGSVVKPESQDPLVSAQPHVLAMYAECLKDQDRPDELAKCLLACLQDPAAHLSPYLAQRQHDQLVEVAERTSDLRMPLLSIAEIVSVDKAISHRAGAGGFTLSLFLRSSIPVELRGLRSATMKLRAIDQQNSHFLWLQCDEIPNIGQEAAKVTFETSISTEGWYEIEHVEIWLGSIRFEYRFQAEQALNPQHGFQRPSTEARQIRAYLPPDSVRLRATQSSITDLSKRRCLIVSISNSGYALSECELKVKPGTAGLRLALHDAVLADEEAETLMKVVYENDTTFFRCGALAPASTLNISIPYTLETGSDNIALLKCTLDGFVNGAHQTLHQTCSAEVNLPISVNVQDIHRDHYWYSHFLISSATSAPVILLGCELDAHEDIDIKASNIFECPITVFLQQPARWLARLRRLKLALTSPSKPLSLTVRYQRLDEAAVGSLRTTFESDAQEAGFGNVTQLLSSHLVNVVTARWTDQDLELLGLSHEVAVLSQTECRWEDVLCALDLETTSRLRDWLGNWHRTRKTISLDLSKAAVRELRLNTDVRSAPTVVTAELTPRLPSVRITAPLGQPLACSLRIAAVGEREANLQYSYELFAPSEAWLIGGKKKGMFSGLEGVDVSIVLFPQRIGLLMLPAIDIQCKRQSTDSAQATDRGLMDVPIEVCNKTLSKVVQITSHLRSSTVGLAPDEAATHTGATGGLSSGILLQSQDRSDAE